jgi:hypothetical protein
VTPLDLWRLGLNVVPVPRPSAHYDGKRPIIAWKSFQTERVPFYLACQWFVGNYTNAAVITGAVSGVVVVDADSEKAIAWCSSKLPKTPWLVRTRKGWHQFYRHPGVPVGNVNLRTHPLKLSADVKGDGGYVIAIGSVHESGSRYLEAGDWSVPKWQLPVFPVNLLEKPAPVVVREPTLKAPGEAQERAERYLRRIPPPVEGCGSDHATYVAACRLVRGFALGQEATIDLLVKWTGFDEWWVRQKVTSAVSNGKQRIGGML